MSQIHFGLPFTDLHPKKDSSQPARLSNQELHRLHIVPPASHSNGVGDLWVVMLEDQALSDLHPGASNRGAGESGGRERRQKP